MNTFGTSLALSFAAIMATVATADADHRAHHATPLGNSIELGARLTDQHREELTKQKVIEHASASEVVEPVPKASRKVRVVYPGPGTSQLRD